MSKKNRALSCSEVAAGRAVPQKNRAPAKRIAHPQKESRTRKKNRAPVKRNERYNQRSRTPKKNTQSMFWVHPTHSYMHTHVIANDLYSCVNYNGNGGGRVNNHGWRILTTRI
jgi:hypothetical protein